MEKYRGDESKISVCIIKENPGKWLRPMEYMTFNLEAIESIMLTRLTPDTFRGIISFEKEITPHSSIDKVEKSLVSDYKTFILNS